MYTSWLLSTIKWPTKVLCDLEDYQPTRTAEVSNQQFYKSKAPSMISKISTCYKVANQNTYINLSITVMACTGQLTKKKKRTSRSTAGDFLELIVLGNILLMNLSFHLLGFDLLCRPTEKLHYSHSTKRRQKEKKYHMK